MDYCGKKNIVLNNSVFQIDILRLKFQLVNDLVCKTKSAAFIYSLNFSGILKANYVSTIGFSYDCSKLSRPTSPCLY